MVRAVVVGSGPNGLAAALISFGSGLVLLVLCTAAMPAA